MVLILGIQAGRDTVLRLEPSHIYHTVAKVAQSVMLTDRLDLPLHGPVSRSQESYQLSTGASGRYEGELSS
jgi:hypothetical protein